jgi:ribose 5-phosphate isomerase B
MRIAIGCDHVGFPLKASIVEALEGEEHAVLDLGTHSSDPVDYPAMTRAVATSLVKGFVDFGVILCETNLGAAIAANKFAGIRAVACGDTESARHSRVRLNANFLCLPGTTLDGEGAVAIVREWLTATFAGDERIAREIAGITEIAEVARNGRRVAHAAERVPKAPVRPPVEVEAAPVSAPAAVAPSLPPPRTTERAAERMSDRVAERIAERIVERAAERPAERIVERAAERPAERPAPAAVSGDRIELIDEPDADGLVPTPPGEPDEVPAPVPTRVPDISAVLRFLASLKDEDIRLMARRVLEVIRNRFPAAEGAPGDNGFTFTLDGKHVATVIIAKRHIELEIGPDRVVTGRIRDLDGFQHALSLPSVMKAFDALRTVP